MDSICTCNSLSTGQSTMEPYTKLCDVSQINHASIASEQSADITIMTAEGDKVTLLSHTQLEASLTTYNSRAYTNTTYIESQGRFVSFNSNRKIAISVEGDLNNQEKKEIKRVIKALFKMAKNFLSGKIENLKEKAEKFIDLKTISNVEAEFEYKKTIALLNHSSARSTDYSPVPEEPSSSEIDRGESAYALKPINRLTDQMMGVVKDSGIRPVKFLKYVDQMLSRLLREFMMEGPIGRKKIGLARMIMAEFYDKLEKSSADSEDCSLQDTTEIGETSYQSKTAHSEMASLLHLNLLEMSNTFRIEYSGGS